MNPLNPSEPEHLCRELSRVFQGTLTWKWDDRFQTVLAEFKVENKARIYEELERRLDRIWDSTLIETAPEAVQTIINGFGGIMPEQLLFTTDPDREFLVFCAWWPWGDGQTISIRIAPFYQQPSEPDRTAETQPLQEWFGINPNP